MSVFDASAISNLMNAEVETEFDTVSVPHPEGEYLFKIVKMEPRAWSKKDDPTINGVSMDVTLEAMDQDVLAELGVEKCTVRGGIPLEIADDGKTLAKGSNKNVALGKFLDAVDCNRAGTPMLAALNQLVMCKVVHELVDDIPYAKVRKFARVN